MLGLIDKQISLLEEAGAKVSVLGVGNRPDFNKKDLNGELSNIVKKHDPSKVTFTGALSDYGAMSKDHVHATNDAYKSILGQINGSPTQAAPEPVKGQAVDEDSRSVNDVKPKVINVIPIPLPSDSDDESDSEIHSSISLPYDATFSKYYTQSVAT
jgi:hypothetical protein